MGLYHAAEPLYLFVVNVDLVGGIGGVPKTNRRQAQQKGSFPDPPGKAGDFLAEAIHPSLQVVFVRIEFIESLEVVVSLTHENQKQIRSNPIGWVLVDRLIDD
jgi:hypothetical protein